MESLDLKPYITERGLIDLDLLLRNSGFVNKNELFNVRIDTVSIAQLLKITTKTLSKYVNAGYIKLDGDRRMSLGEVLKIDFMSMKRQLRISTPVKVRHKINLNNISHVRR